jgi:hypothetical protein
VHFEACDATVGCQLRSQSLKRPQPFALHQYNRWVEVRVYDYHLVCGAKERNSLEFDERLLRQTFYQNLKPVYLTNTNRNTRADALRLVQAATVYVPDSIIVPVIGEGRQTRRLDAIARANGFNHH